MKRITTPKLLGLLVGSLLLFAGLITFENAGKVPPPPVPYWAKGSPTRPASMGLAKAVLRVTLLLTTLAACVILGGPLMNRIGAQQFILFFGAVVFVLCGLFPPWLYTYDVTATHSRSNAGCAFILSPPLPMEDSAVCGIQIDTSRFLIEWAFQTVNGPLYVNPGIGYIYDYNFRFNCRPEITLLEI